jgi:hypothetical protein
MAQRKLDDAKALAEYQARLASQPMQYAGPIDDAGNARAATAQQRTANNLTAALGGPFVAAPMLTARAAGLDEHQVEQAGMLGLAALDAAGIKGGVSVTRLGSRPRGLGGLTPAEQAGQLAKAGDMPEGAALFRNKFPADAIGLQRIVSGVKIVSGVRSCLLPPHAASHLTKVTLQRTKAAPTLRLPRNQGVRPPSRNPRRSLNEDDDDHHMQ